jgi:hypothetical protein
MHHLERCGVREAVQQKQEEPDEAEAPHEQ